MFYFSSIEPIYLVLPLIGLIIGLFGTMLGGGGGFFFLPLLTLGFGVPLQMAVVTSLVATLPICIVGAWGHYRKQNVDFKVAAVFAIFGIGGALLGAYVTSVISARQLQIGFGIYSLLMALNIAYGNMRQQAASDVDDWNIQNTSKLIKSAKGAFFGFSAGSITGVFGTSGSAPILAGLFALKLPLKMVVGTSLFVVLVNTIFAVGAHLLVSEVDVTLVAFLTIGSIVGAFAGPHLMSRWKIEKSEGHVKYAYALVIATIGLIMTIG